MIESSSGVSCVGRVAMTDAERSRRYRKLAKKRRRAANCEWFKPDLVVLDMNYPTFPDFRSRNGSRRTNIRKSENSLCSRCDERPLTRRTKSLTG